MISVVTPWRTLLSALGLIGRVKSEWVLMSMKPGATVRPAASMIFSAGALIGEPIAATRHSTATMMKSRMAQHEVGESQHGASLGQSSAADKRGHASILIKLILATQV